MGVDDSFMEYLKNLFRTFSVLILVGLVLAVGVVGWFVYRVVSDLPEVSTLKDFRHPVATQVFSSDGKVVGEFTTQRRYRVAYEDIPEHVKKAFVAAEDSHFFEHGGIDLIGIGRAIFSNILRGRYAQGGSTITQQVARSILLASREKKLTRKLREIILALRMEQQLSKGEILSLYLNEIYLGHGAFGIGAAAQNYFNKRVQDLTIAEGALLAGLPQRPNEWTPFRNPHLGKKRQAYVLHRMLDDGFISEEQYQEATSQPLKLYAQEEFNKEAPYFTEYVRQYLMSKYGSENVLTQGFRVYTTVHYDMQKAAERALRDGLNEVDKRLGWRGVKERVETPEQFQEFSMRIHEKVLSGITTGRLLPPAIDEDFRKLIYDLEPLQKPNSPYFGITPVKEGATYRAAIARIEMGKTPRAFAQVGETTVILPWSTMEAWVRAQDNPTQTLDSVLKVGDVVNVRVEKIERQLNQVLGTLEQIPEIQGALLSFEVETGAVRAMVGGRDFDESEFNCALQAKRQVGSTFKPILYAAALDKGFSPSSLVTDAPIVFKFEGELDSDNVGEDWRPHNYGGSFKGDVPLRLALIRSMNIPTVKLLNEIGVDSGIDYARRVGIQAALPRDLSIALGSWSTSLDEIMRAYSVFPRLGTRPSLQFIRQIVDSAGNVLEDYPLAESPYYRSALASTSRPLSPPPTVEGQAPAGETVVEPAISPQTAYVMTDMLKAVVREGTGRRAAAIGGSVAGKTGTSNDHRDAWFIGYTPTVISGVWLGYLKDKPLNSEETGGKAAAPIWANFMETAIKYYPRKEFPIPEQIVFANIDPDTGKLASSRTTNRVRAAFKVGTVPDRVAENLPRIGEPGARSMSAVGAGSIPPPTSATEPAPEVLNNSEDEAAGDPSEETADFMRQGYE